MVPAPCEARAVTPRTGRVVAGETDATRERRRIHVTESLTELSGNLIFGPPKTHVQRQVPLPPSVVELLARHTETVPAGPDALLFTSSRGLPLRYSRFRPTVWLPTLDATGLPRGGL